jgi:hypothetical protein
MSSETVQNRHPVTLHTSIVISVRMDLSDCKGLHEINTSPEKVQYRHPVSLLTSIVISVEIEDIRTSHRLYRSELFLRRITYSSALTLRSNLIFPNNAWAQKLVNIHSSHETYLFSI